MRTISLFALPSELGGDTFTSSAPTGDGTSVAGPLIGDDDAKSTGRNGSDGDRSTAIFGGDAKARPVPLVVNALLVPTSASAARKLLLAKIFMFEFLNF
jgi:hypothetical protein